MNPEMNMTLNDTQACQALVSSDPFQARELTSATLTARVLAAAVPTTRAQYAALDKLHTECVRAGAFAAAHHVFTQMYRSQVR